MAPVTDPQTTAPESPGPSGATVSPPGAVGDSSKTPGTPWFFRYRSGVNIALTLLLLVWPGSREPFGGWRLAAALLLIVLGLFLRFWCIRQLGGAARKSSRPKATRLVTWGPFGHLRNPIYVANMVFFAGFVGLAGLFRFLPLFLAAMFIQYSFTVRFEESFLRTQFGEDFERYCKTTRRWIPSLRAPSPPADFQPYPIAKLLRRERSFLVLQALGGTAAFLILRIYLLPLLSGASG